MCLQSTHQSSTVTDCPLRQLEIVQERTATNKRYLADLKPFTTTNDPLYPELIGDTYILARNSFCSSKPDIRQLDLIIHDIQNTLARARGTRLDVVRFTAEFEAIFHPVRSLPDDILLLIFRWCIIDHEGQGNHCGSLDLTYPSWTLSHVCRRWRNLALEAPFLWSVVRFRRRHQDQYEGLNLSRLSLQLQRSGTSPLDVEIDKRYGCSSVVGGKGPPLALLRSTTSRWWSLSMGIQSGVEGNNDSDIFSGCSFDNLTHLKVRDNSIYENSIPITAFRQTPRLTHLSTFGEFRMDLDWDRIVTYMTSIYTLTTHSQLLSVRQLTLDVVEYYTPVDQLFKRPSSIHMPCLLTLTLSYNDPRLLNYLYAPSLETLHMPLPLFLPPYPDLRSLRNLSIFHGRPDTQEDLRRTVSFFAEMPNVTVLHLQTEVLLETTVLRLNGQDDIFPNLERLIVDNLELTFADPKIMVELRAIIESRLNVPAPKISELRLTGEQVDLCEWYPARSVPWEVLTEKLFYLGITVS